MSRTDAASNSYDQARAARDEALSVRLSRDKDVSRLRDEEDWMKGRGEGIASLHTTFPCRVAARDYGKQGKEG
jgi:hypothetical protein